MNKKFQSIFTGSISFIITVLITVLAYANVGIYPGSVNTILIYDMKAQLISFYGYLSHGGPGFDSLLYSMSGALGGGFFGTIALYVSPLDLIYCFISLKDLPDAIYVLTVLRIGLSAAFFSVFLVCTRNSLNRFNIIVLSCCYGLMSYVFMYSMSPMWLDLVMYLPVLALFIEKVVNGKKSISFIFLLSFCIISDYYIAYMVVIAIVLYYLFRLVEDGNSLKDCIKKLILLGIHGFFSAGLSAFVLLPVIIDFGRGKLIEASNGQKSVFIKNTFSAVLRNFAPMRYTSLDDVVPPNIFCGSFILFFSLIWFLAGKKNLKARIAGILILAIYFASFIFGPVDRIWHGFRNPIGFSFRYAFTFVFFLVCFAARGLESVSVLKLKRYESLIRLLIGIFSFYTFFELYLNGSFILSKHAVEKYYTNREEYNRYCDVLGGLLSIADEDDTYDYSRIFKNFKYSNFDGALFGYDGIERFSSSYNYPVSRFLADLGIGSSFHTSSEYGMNPVVGSIFDVGYMISWHRDYSDYYDLIGEYRGYTVYSNPNCIPLAFSVDLNESGNEQFTDNKFENINIFIRDLTDLNGDESVFEEQPYEISERSPEDFLGNVTIDSNDYIFECEEDSHYWFYSENVDIYGDESRSEWMKRITNANDAYADYYLNGEKTPLFRNVEFSFLNDLGCLEAGSRNVLTLDSSISRIGNTYIYRYNDGLFKKVADELKDKSYRIESIDSSGIKLKGFSKTDSYVLVTIPYEDGYKVYVDGIATDYCAYRNALLLVGVTAGEHIIEISYIPPGLIQGIIISSMFFMLIVAACIFDNYSIRKKKQ